MTDDEGTITEGMRGISDRIIDLWAHGDKDEDGCPDLGDLSNELIGDYLDAMAELANAKADVTTWSDRRAYTLAKLHAHGWSLARIAEAVCLSRARVQQLVERGRGVQP